MFYRCENCGGNVIYNPIAKKMICESCGSESSQKIREQDDMRICDNCGGDLALKEHTLSCKCPYCGTYIIVKSRLLDEFRPDLVLPFVIDRHKAYDLLVENFKKKMFLPKGFLNISTMEQIEGMYVPFWLFDLKTHMDYSGEGDIVRCWRSGKYEYTETKIYRIIREFEAEYDKIPADACESLDNDLMDILEPYAYEELIEFNPDYLSGFHAETYDEDKDTVKPRALTRAANYADMHIGSTTGQYSAVRETFRRVESTEQNGYYAFLPVWRYVYRFENQNYEFFVNGQTGKVVGAPPVSKKRMFGLSGLFGVSVFLFLSMLIRFMEVL